MSEQFLSYDNLLVSRSLGGTSVATAGPVAFKRSIRGEGIALLVSKTGGTGNVRVQYAQSLYGTSVNSSFTGNSNIIETTQSIFPSSPKRWNFVALPLFLAPYVFFRFTGVTGNPATGVTVNAVLFKRYEF